MESRALATQLTRVRLLDAAVDVLAEVGADALTMQMVADRAGLALRTVYNHFATKEALVVEAYTRLANAVQSAVEAVPPDEPVRERLAHFVDAVFGAYELDSPGAAAVLSVTGIPQFSARVAEVRAWRRAQIRTLLEPAAATGSLYQSLDDAIALTFLFTAFATWSSLVDESGLTADAARALTRQSLDSLLFGRTD
jgi:AcrR family transcriptional regulator